MAFDAYLKLDGVEGEATDKGFEKQINILSFSWGVSNPSTPIGTGAGAGKVSVSDFSVMKWTDKSSANLFQSCCSGKHYPKATLTLRKAGGDKPVDYLKYEFKTLFVTSLQWSGSRGGDDVPTESVSFSFASVEVTYTEQSEKGAAAKPQIAGWDFKQNAKV
jgi:type VI secretion system secreted protein Hcp